MPNRRIRHHARLFTPAPRPRGEYLPSPPERHHRRPVLPPATCVVLCVRGGGRGGSRCASGRVLARFDKDDRRRAGERRMPT
ncbi:hypothetical protein FA13DRAFT_680331 [Coprinellus micaceus]|uniref:Uncharacterized protein n=1 Tax=Coprinellus micaceus TaxID=71717 RepID=A0A4Y7S9U0_COPMI|nr:hypothetical protein FA13DRAFT_680331 [Coprinellus micaceus]